MNGPSYFTQETNDHLYVTQGNSGETSAVWLSDQMRVAVRHDRSGLAWVLAMRRVLFDVEQRIETLLHTASVAAEEQAGKVTNARFASLNAEPPGTVSTATTIPFQRHPICDHEACGPSDDGGTAA